MAAARALAGISVVSSVWLALSYHGLPNAGLAVVVGWLAVGFLVAGLVSGDRLALAAVGVGFVVRMAVLAVLDVAAPMPVWIEVFVLVTCLEAGALSIEMRTNPAPLTTGISLGVSNVALVSLVALILSEAVAGSSIDGILVQAGGVIAAVLAIGWVLRTWERSGADRSQSRVVAEISRSRSR